MTWVSAAGPPADDAMATTSKFEVWGAVSTIRSSPVGVVSDQGTKTSSTASMAGSPGEEEHGPQMLCRPHGRQ